MELILLAALKPPRYGSVTWSAKKLLYIYF